MSRKEIRQKKKSKIQVRKALLISALSTMMCLTMLLGTTFAWFTDTAATSVNTVNAGDLKLGLEYAYAAGSSAAEDTATWQPVKGISNKTAILKDVGTHGVADKAWEPGLAKYVQLKVKNDGDLSLKYKLGLVIEEETAGRNTANRTIKLSNYLQAAILDGAQNFDSSVKAIEAVKNNAKLLSQGCITEGELYPELKNPEAAATSAENATSNTAGAAGNADSRPSEKIITIVVYYPESATAETSALDKESVPNISIGVRAFAGQLADESDSNGSSYDENAPLETASTPEELTKAIEDALPGDTIALTDDIVISSALTIDKELTIDLNGKTVTATENFATINSEAKLTIAGGTVESGRYVFNVKGGEVVVNDGSFTAQETVCALFGGSKLTVNDGTFTSKDNAVVATNGSSAKGCEINIDGGVFNANIQTAGYIACGVYVANKDTVRINASTFNITDGVGVLMRAGHTTIGNDVVINLTNTGKITAGKVGDAKIDITTPSYLVMDVRSGYPGATAGFTITNNSNYKLVEYK
mgnify:CR=1 FL=1